MKKAMRIVDTGRGLSTPRIVDAAKKISGMYFEVLFRDYLKVRIKGFGYFDDSPHC
jgi:hypothetical protein